MARARLSASGEQERRAGRGSAGETQPGWGARRWEAAGGTCEFTLLRQVGWAGAAGDAHQGGGDLRVPTVHIQVTAGQGQLQEEAGKKTR